MEKINYESIIDDKVFFYLFYKNKENQIISNESIVHSICILSFDDEIGQIVESVWPINSISKLCLKNISSLGFPETNCINEDGEIKYIFKIRQSKMK